MDKVKRALEVIEMKLGCAERISACGGMCEICCYGQFSRNEEIEALKIAEECIMKQTPKKAKFQDEDECVCPQCGEVVDDGDRMCDECNQLLDWS